MIPIFALYTAAFKQLLFNQSYYDISFHGMIACTVSCKKNDQIKGKLLHERIMGYPYITISFSSLRQDKWGVKFIVKNYETI